jgi:hypothetical protein
MRRIASKSRSRGRDGPIAGRAPTDFGPGTSNQKKFKCELVAECRRIRARGLVSVTAAKRRCHRCNKCPDQHSDAGINRQVGVGLAARIRGLPDVGLRSLHPVRSHH